MLLSDFCITELFRPHHCFSCPKVSQSSLLAHQKVNFHTFFIRGHLFDRKSLQKRSKVSKNLIFYHYARFWAPDIKIAAVFTQKPSSSQVDWYLTQEK